MDPNYVTAQTQLPPYAYGFNGQFGSAPMYYEPLYHYGAPAPNPAQYAQCVQCAQCVQQQPPNPVQYAQHVQQRADPPVQYVQQRADPPVQYVQQQVDPPVQNVQQRADPPPAQYAQHVQQRESPERNNTSKRSSARTIISNQRVTKHEEKKSALFIWPCKTLDVRNGCYHSETFSLSACPLMEFALFIETNSFSSLTVGLEVKDKIAEESVSLLVKFWLKLDDNLNFDEYTVRCEFNETGDKIKFKTSKESEKFIKMIGNGRKLTICCKIEYLSAVFKAPDDLSKALWKVYEDGQGHDVVIKVEGKEFKVFSAVFTSQSDVFDSMLSADYVEGQEKKVLIEDITAEAFEAFVRWMYTKEIRSLDTIEELYVIANKYLIQALKVQCTKLIFAGLNKDNAARRLALFMKYDEAVIAERVMTFICNLGSSEIKKVFETKDWLDYLMFKNSLGELSE